MYISSLLLTVPCELSELSVFCGFKYLKYCTWIICMLIESGLLMGWSQWLDYCLSQMCLGGHLHTFHHQIWSIKCMILKMHEGAFNNILDQTQTPRIHPPPSNRMYPKTQALSHCHTSLFNSILVLWFKFPLNVRTAESVLIFRSGLDAWGISGNPAETNHGLNIDHDSSARRRSLFGALSINIHDIKGCG